MPLILCSRRWCRQSVASKRAANILLTLPVVISWSQIRWGLRRGQISALLSLNNKICQGTACEARLWKIFLLRAITGFRSFRGNLEILRRCLWVGYSASSGFLGFGARNSEILRWCLKVMLSASSGFLGLCGKLRNPEEVLVKGKIRFLRISRYWW